LFLDLMILKLLTHLHDQTRLNIFPFLLRLDGSLLELCPDDTQGLILFNFSVALKRLRNHILAYALKNTNFPLKWQTEALLWDFTAHLIDKGLFAEPNHFHVSRMQLS
jgi:hypothetical protein